MMIMRPRIVICSLFTILYLSPGHAITDGERTALHRLHQELIIIQPIIDEAEQNANNKNGARVEYDQLRGDIQKIERGVVDILNSQRREPRSLPLIDGDYR
jgi:RAQPRD family integrative conjugative element protein